MTLTTRSLSAVLLIACTWDVLADSWELPKTLTERLFSFGDTRIVRITDGRNDQVRPELHLSGRMPKISLD